MSDPIPADYRRPRSPALASLHDRYGIGTDPERTAEYMQAVDDAREIQEIAEERDAAQVELAEARRLLAMATAFDAGPLLPDCSYHWATGALRGADDSTPVRITLWPVDPPCWVVGIAPFATLKIDGEWMAGPTDAIATRCGFPSPAAALAALDSWRAARRAEIDGRAVGEGGGVVAQTGEEAP